MNDRGILVAVLVLAAAMGTSYAAPAGMSKPGDAHCGAAPGPVLLAPEDNAAGIDPDVAITIRFSREIRFPPGPLPEILKIHGSMSGEVVTGELSGSGSATLRFRPARRFYRGEIVSVELGQAISGFDGGCPVRGFKWQFRVRPPVGHA